MGQIAEALAQSDGLTREDQDGYAAESHRRAVAAMAQGLFDHEVVPLTVKLRKAELVVNCDEGPRAESTSAQLARLSPVFDAAGTVTAGNASMISDGAAAVVVASRVFQEAHGLTPLGRIVAYATAGMEPGDLFVAPVAAITKALYRAGVAINDVDLFEINEAFAAQMLACVRRLQLPLEKVNVHGGAISLGHPLGASGARVVTTLLHALRQRRQRWGVAALCLGGGNAVAAVFERLS